MGSVSIGRMSRDDSQTKAGIFDTILNCKVNLFMMFVILTSYCLCRYIYLSQDGINNMKIQRSGSFAPASPYRASTGSGKTSLFSSVQLFSFVVDCLALLQAMISWSHFEFLFARSRHQEWSGREIDRLVLFWQYDCGGAQGTKKEKNGGPHKKSYRKYNAGSDIYSKFFHYMLENILSPEYSAGSFLKGKAKYLTMPFIYIICCIISIAPH